MDRVPRRRQARLRLTAAPDRNGRNVLAQASRSASPWTETPVTRRQRSTCSLVLTIVLISAIAAGDGDCAHLPFLALLL